MIPKTLLLSTVALSGVCYAGLLCSDQNSLWPWITENFEKIKPLLEESIITTPNIYENGEDVVYVAGTTTLKPREDNSSPSIKPTDPKVLPEKEKSITSEPTTIPFESTDVKNQSLKKPKSNSKPAKPAKLGPSTLFTRSPKINKRNPSNTPKKPKRRYIRGRGRAV